MNDLIEKYRKNIPAFEEIEAFKVYYATKDSKIREKLIFRYMPIARRLVLNYNITTVEEEDLIQMSYEALMHCINIYNPYGKISFYLCLYYKIKRMCKKYMTNGYDNVSLSNIEIYSNEDLESSVIDKIFIKELYGIIEKMLDEYPNNITLNIFKKLYGINSKKLTPLEISQELNISKQQISQAKNTMLSYLFLEINSKYQYYPSKNVEKVIYNPNLYKISKYAKDRFKELNIDELEYLIFYDDCNSIENSHELVKK